MAGKSKLTQQMCHEIYAMSLGGVKAAYIAKVFSLSESTVSRIVCAKGSLDQYHERQTESWKKYGRKSKIEKEKPKANISDMYGMNRIYEEMKKQTELLERIVALWQS